MDIQVEPMTVENDLLTPTFKVKRQKAVKHYERFVLISSGLLMKSERERERSSLFN